jgi:hypothetical protein
MHWCQPSGSLELLTDGGRQRGTVAGWSSENIDGIPLTVEPISGHLLRVQRFQGTICRVEDFDYLLRKLNNE